MKVAPARIRGRVVIINNICISGGQFVGYLVALALTSSETNKNND